MPIRPRNPAPAAGGQLGMGRAQGTAAMDETSDPCEPTVRNWLVPVFVGPYVGATAVLPFFYNAEDLVILVPFCYSFPFLLLGVMLVIVDTCVILLGGRTWRAITGARGWVLGALTPYAILLGKPAWGPGWSRPQGSEESSAGSSSHRSSARSPFSSRPACRSSPRGRCEPRGRSRPWPGTARARRR